MFALDYIFIVLTVVSVFALERWKSWRRQNAWRREAKRQALAERR